MNTITTQYYHCISRCVRRAFLCGFDRVSGHNFDHRRQWVRERLAWLVDVFAIDLCAYAIMSNHYHLVLRVDPSRAESWSDREVVERWRRLHRGPEVARRYLDGAELSPGEQARMDDIILLWRQRLTDISWFMRSLNGYIARQANREDGCNGHFFEGRFKSQALLDEQAVLACMAYVDLNPVRAGMADTPEDSDYTSIQQRAGELAVDEGRAAIDDTTHPVLAPMVDAANVEADCSRTVCGVRLLDYLQLVDDTGRAVRQGKRGVVPARSLPVLRRLGIDDRAWLRHMRPRPNYLLQAVGAVDRARRYAKVTGRRWLWGIGLFPALYSGEPRAGNA